MFNNFTWARDNSATPFLVKIDVEGAEAGILRGAQETLSAHRPIFLCEILNDQAGSDVEAALPRFYHFYYIDENRGIIIKRRINRRRWRDKNWLLTPAEAPLFGNMAPPLTV